MKSKLDKKINYFYLIYKHNNICSYFFKFSMKKCNMSNRKNSEYIPKKFIHI